MSFPVVFRNRNRSLVLWGCILVTLGISPWKNYDSVNLPKSLILSSFAFALIAFHFFYRKTELKIIDMKMLVLCAIFIISLSLPLLFTEAPLNQQFWGIFGRGNGWLSYACLLVMFYSASLFTQYFDFIKLINAFIVTASILSVYALIQFGGKDPIPWSQKMVIATLGNINFLSAFFGMTSLAAVSLAISGDTGTLKKVFLFSLTLIDLFLVQFTGSIQGIMLFCGGSLLIIYLKFRNNLGFHNLRYFYLIFVTLSLTAVIAGLANQGPLARYIFAPSVLFRADYWHAGFKISLAHPFFGVGLDSYGDYYREFRGLISTTRTIPERVANTSHNIFLDLSSGGGFVLLLAYSAIVLMAILASFRIIRRTKVYDPISSALLSVFLGYQIQSLVSIAQIGVSVWGWVFMGAIVAFDRVSRAEMFKFPHQPGIKVNTGKKRVRENNVELPAKVLLSSILGATVGLLLAFPPLKTDAEFRAAMERGDVEKMSRVVQQMSSSAYLVGLTLQKAVTDGNQPVSDGLNNYLNDNYPRDMYGWRVRYAKPWATPTEKALAIQKMRALDPYNPEIPQS